MSEAVQKPSYVFALYLTGIWLGFISVLGFLSLLEKIENDCKMFFFLIWALLPAARSHHAKRFIFSAADVFKCSNVLWNYFVELFTFRTKHVRVIVRSFGAILKITFDSEKYFQIEVQSPQDNFEIQFCLLLIVSAVIFSSIYSFFPLRPCPLPSGRSGLSCPILWNLKLTRRRIN